ncbi:MAG: hypothetical protein PHX78_04515 [bacterium]|nr:hypothetical protein [bacterium]
MKRIFIFSLIFIFVLNPAFIVYSQDNYSNESIDTSNIKEMVKSKMTALEELIEYEIMISEFYNGDYHLTLKKAIEFTSQAKGYIEKGEFDQAIKKIEFAEDFANKVFNLSNYESNDLKSKVENRMQQLDILFECCNRLYFNNDFTGFSVKLKELFQQARVSYENARAEAKRKEYISAQDSISFAVDCLLSAMKLSVEELYPAIEGIIKEKVVDLDELVKDDMDSILESGNEEIQWYFNQGLKYRDMAEKDMQKDFVRSYEMIQLSRGYCSMALKMVRDKKKDSTFVAISKFEQNKIEELEIKNKKEYDFFKAYEKIWDMKNRLSYQDPLVARVIIAVNGSNDYVLKTRLKRLMDFKKSAEVSSFLENNKLAYSFQYCVAKLSYKLLELSKIKTAKTDSSGKKP